jgi:hypothetical protein
MQVHDSTLSGSVVSICRAVLAALAIAALTTGCVFVPYKPPASTEHAYTAIPNPERLLLSVGPRQYLEIAAKEIVEIDQRFQLVDGQAFIDMVSPSTALTLARLLEPGAIRLAETMDTDYLVLIGRPETIAFDEKEGFPVVRYNKLSTSHWAAVVDTRRMQLIRQLTSKSVGVESEGWGGPIVWGVFADTEGSALEELLPQIAGVLGESKPTGTVRFVLLAVD